MLPIGSANISCVDCRTSRSVVRLLLLALSATTLAACAQSSVVSQRSDLRETSHASLEPNKRVASVKKHTPFVLHKTADTKLASQGIASFYTEGTETASGEKFNTHELTAAHPTLPFGTRLRVTNVSTGRSVTVRVNDRGPYVPGRIVDVSYSAADALGMVGKGIANVKLDVVQ